jgi:hypothetical protein
MVELYLHYPISLHGIVTLLIVHSNGSPLLELDTKVLSIGVGKLTPACVGAVTLVLELKFLAAVTVKEYRFLRCDTV